MEDIRVFVSYSHEERDKVSQLCDVLRENGLTPMTDQGFAFGTGFPEQIKAYIAHAHVFLPFVTKRSSERGWVHQEIGYASALNIPVMPVTVEADPPGIIAMVHGAQLKENLEDAAKKLTRDRFEWLVCVAARSDRPPLYECAADNRMRARMFADYADGIRGIGFTGCVRQKGALTSFHIPDTHVRGRAWERRWDDGLRDRHYCQRLRNERLALQAHADAEGCRLIINPKALEDAQYSADSRLGRVEQLLAFLQDSENEHTLVVPNREVHREESVTIVGDWFSARSVSIEPGRGYQQTMFTRHAPTVRQEMEEFDEQFAELLQLNDMTEENCRERVIAQLEEMAEGLAAE